MMEIATIPGAFVKAYLRGLRLPLTGLETLAGRRDNNAWPPALAFENFEANAKLIVGSLLRDAELVDEARIQQVKVAELRRAAELEMFAEQTRAAAEAEEDAKLEQLRQHSEQADREAQARRKRVEAREQAAAERSARKHAQRVNAVAKADEAREQRLEKVERATRLRSLQAESAALATEREAVAAVDKVAALDNALEQKKAERTTR